MAKTSNPLTIRRLLVSTTLAAIPFSILPLDNVYSVSLASAVSISLFGLGIMTARHNFEKAFGLGWVAMAMAAVFYLFFRLVIALPSF
jgi:hypothetical protein